MTEFNTICRRPHWPREAPIRTLLKALDISLPPKPDHGGESDSEDEVEASESEAETSDEEVGGRNTLQSVLCGTGLQVKKVMELRLRRTRSGMSV